MHLSARSAVFLKQGFDGIFLRPLNSIFLVGNYKGSLSFAAFKLQESETSVPIFLEPAFCSGHKRSRDFDLENLEK